MAKQNEITFITHVLTKKPMFFLISETSTRLYMHIHFIFKTSEHRGITHKHSFLKLLSLAHTDYIIIRFLDDSQVLYRFKAKALKKTVIIVTSCMKLQKSTISASVFWAADSLSVFIETTVMKKISAQIDYLVLDYKHY